MELCCTQKFEYDEKKEFIWNKWTTWIAAKNGHLECLKFAHQNGCPWNEKTCLTAAHYGNLECLKYAHENGCPWDILTCTWAAHNGNLECLIYAHENGCPWSHLMCQFAARNGHINCLKYAHENGCLWDRLTTRAAAENGHLECLKYVHQNGCPWDQSTCEYAARNGHLECLKYAHQNGCPWDQWTCAWAVDYWGNDSTEDDPNFQCLKYAHENGCPWDQWTCSNSVRNGNLNCLKYAHQNGCPWFRFQSFTYNSQVPLDKFSNCLEYLNAHSHPSCQEICTLAAGVNLELLSYWYSKLTLPRDPEEEKRAYLMAISQDQFDCFKYLDQLGFTRSKKIFPLIQRQRNPHFNKIKYLMYAYNQQFPGRDLAYQDPILQKELLSKNLEIYYSSCLIVRKYLKIYVRNFIEKYYSPEGKGYFSSQKHFSSLAKTMGNEVNF